MASASARGAPYLVPLSFDWDGEAPLVATPTDSPSGKNLATTRAVRLGLGYARDVSTIDGPPADLHPAPNYGYLALGVRFPMHGERMTTASAQ